MKSIAIVAVLATGVLATGTTNATSGEELAKSSGCLGCHAIDTKKVGPAYKEVAKKFKGKSQSDVATTMKVAPVHASLKVSDKDLKEILEWILKL
jgi:cytochrome c